MLLKYRTLFDWSATAILLSVLFHIPVTSAKTSKQQPVTCPLGFTVAFTKDRGDPVCYRLKGPEKFAEKFDDCTGNLYSPKLLADLAFTPQNVKLWSDFKTLYPGGPFIDWSYADSTGNVLTSTFEVHYDAAQGIDEEFCTILEPNKNLTAVRCNEKYHRYCFVRPYEYWKLDECETGYTRFFSPRASCLQAARGIGGSVRATWRQARDLCSREGASLVQRGWRYANYPDLHINNSSKIWSEPLGLIMTLGDNLMWLDPEDGNRKVANSEWNFRDEKFPANSSLVALVNDSWQLVDSAHVFYDVICEQPIHLPSVNMTIRNDDGYLMLTVNDSSVKADDIWCFSDSVIFYPSRVKVSRTQIPNNYVLTPISDGYYWCILSNTVNYTLSQSNKELFIRDRKAVDNLYSIKIRIKRKYSFENLEKLLKVWTKKLNEFIFVRTRYLKKHGDFETTDEREMQNILKRFKSEEDLSDEVIDVILYQKIKRVYLDRKTVLLHAFINAQMEPLAPSFWEDLEIIFMRPIYHCKGFYNIPTTPLGERVSIDGCKTYSCVGDFNEGVQWLETESIDCTHRQTQPITEIKPTSEFYVVTELIPIEEDFPTKGVPIFPITVRNWLGHLSGRNFSDENSSSSEDFFTTETTTEQKSETISISTTHPPETTKTEVVTTVTMPYPTTVTHPPTEQPPPTMPPLPPEDQVSGVLDHLEQILHDDSRPVTVDIIDDAFNQVDDILDFSDQVDIPGQLLHLLDELGSRAYLNGSFMSSSVRRNVALLMADSGPKSPVRGLRIASRTEDAFTEDAFEILSDEANMSQMDSNTSELVVQLPESLMTSERRISFVVFRNDRAFKHVVGSHQLTVNSRVLSINVENVTNFDNSEVVDINMRPFVGELERNETRTCAYWKFVGNGSGHWSQEGCTFIRSTRADRLDTCRCTHLTHFAEIVAPRSVFSERNENALEIISLIGCYTSIFGLICIAITAALFRVWRRDFSNKVWLQLCIAILLLIVCFLIVVYAKFDTYNIPCMLVGVALHYAVLASFCWMLVAAVLSYRRLVIVFGQDMSHKLLRSSAFAWGAPCAVVGVLLSVDPHSYAGRFHDKTLTASFCYPTGLGLWLALYTPVALMLLANWTLFSLIVYSVFASRRVQRHGGTNEALRCATVSCLLVFLFGLPWIFGLFATNIVFAYLFTLTATFQGFVLFLFFVVGNKKTRDMWLNKLRIKQQRKVPVTSSTYKSSGRPAGSSSTGASRSQYLKPRALVVTDDSGFS